MGKHRNGAYGPSTRAIHGRQTVDPSTGAVIPPIYATSTYVQSSPGKHQGWEYSRSQNPTRAAFEAAWGAARLDSPALRRWLRSYRTALNSVTSAW